MGKWAILGLVGLLGCTSPSPPKISCTKACALEAIVRVDPGFSEAERKEVWAGLRTWTKASHGAVCFKPQPPGSRAFHLVVIRGETQESLRPYIDEHEKYAAIQKDQAIVIAMDVSKDHLAGIAAHEAGHSLGLDHNSDTHAVMNYQSGPLVDGHLPDTDRLTFRRTRCR